MAHRRTEFWYHKDARMELKLLKAVYNSFNSECLAVGCKATERLSNGSRPEPLEYREGGTLPCAVGFPYRGFMCKVRRGRTLTEGAEV